MINLLEDMHNAATAVSGNKMTSPGALTIQMTQPRRRGGQSSQNDQSDKTMYYESQVIVLNEGGQVGIQDNNITFTQCDTVTILLGAGTSYIMDYQKKFQGEHPQEWKSGSVKGLCARGGFEVDIQWEDGKLKNAVLRSKNGQECKIRYQQKVVDIKCSSGQPHIFDAALNQTN